MPFKSQAQRRWMYAKKPGMAKEWESETPKGKKLPDHVEKKAMAELGRKVATALQNVSLIPGAPPVKRLPTTPAAAPKAPAAGQPPAGQPAPAPQPQPGANGVPQTPAAAIPQAPTAATLAGKQPMTTQASTLTPKQQHPEIINNSDAIVANKVNAMKPQAPPTPAQERISKMARVHLKIIGNQLIERLRKA